MVRQENDENITDLTQITKFCLIQGTDIRSNSKESIP